MTDHSKKKFPWDLNVLAAKIVRLTAEGKLETLPNKDNKKPQDPGHPWRYG
jgi:hypothetical protein